MLSDRQKKDVWGNRSRDSRAWLHETKELVLTTSTETDSKPLNATHAFQSADFLPGNVNCITLIEMSFKINACH
jgi:hypothetical protein